MEKWTDRGRQRENVETRGCAQANVEDGVGMVGKQTVSLPIIITMWSLFAWDWNLQLVAW